jgi:hypothetical protein
LNRNCQKNAFEEDFDKENIPENLLGQRQSLTTNHETNKLKHAGQTFKNSHYIFSTFPSCSSEIVCPHNMAVPFARRPSCPFTEVQAALKSPEKVILKSKNSNYSFVYHPDSFYLHFPEQFKGMVRDLKMDDDVESEDELIEKSVVAGYSHILNSLVRKSDPKEAQKIQEKYQNPNWYRRWHVKND